MAATLISSHTAYSLCYKVLQFKKGQESLQSSFCIIIFQEDSERFLASLKGSLTSTRVFDHQPRFLDIPYNLNLLLSLTFLNHTWFLLQTPDLFKVAPSSPCSQSSAFLLHWLTAELLRVHSLLPFLCLPPSQTSIRVSAPRGKPTRVWFGQVSLNQVSLVQF